MIERRNGPIRWFQFPVLCAHDDIVTHGVFARHGGVSTGPFGSLNAGPATPDDPAALVENYRRIHATLDGHPLLVGTRPLQGTTVREVAEADVRVGTPPALLLEQGCDSFITQVRRIGLFWAVADCSVILLVDPAHQAIGLAHAGWRGTSGAIVRATIEAMRTRYSTRPADVIAAIGPTIGPCCYEVDERVREEFDRDPLARRTARFSTVIVATAGGDERRSLRLDLVASNRAQLVELGVPEQQIEASDICPGTRTDLFFSHRMEGGHTGRFAIVLSLR